MNDDTVQKFRHCFDSMAVYKDLRKNNFFSTLGLPSFMRDWLLQKFENEEGVFDTENLREFVKTYIPKYDDWTSIKDRIVFNYEKVKLLAKVVIDINIVTGEVSFSMPDFGLGNKETMIEPDVWERCKHELVSGRETWGMLELGYRMPDDTAKPKVPGKIRLLSFKNFCPYDINTEYYKEVRKEFRLMNGSIFFLGPLITTLPDMIPLITMTQHCQKLR